MANFCGPTEYNGKTYFSTGKSGRNRATQKLVVEKEADDGSRIWVSYDGSVYPE